MSKIFYSVVSFAALAAVSIPAIADDNERPNGLQAIPFTFVGMAPGCAPSPGGSNIVTSAWLPGMGLPDDGSSNVTPSTPPNRDPHFGLLLSKNGATADCSAAGATITGANGVIVTAKTEFGFDLREGGHCGSGAPRFNVTTTDNVTHFAGCLDDNLNPHTLAPQDPAHWHRRRLNPAQFSPPLIIGTTIKSILIVFDEGTDSLGMDDPLGVGLAVIDNIDVNGTLITRGPNTSNNNNDNNDKNN